MTIDDECRQLPSQTPTSKAQIQENDCRNPPPAHTDITNTNPPLLRRTINTISGDFAGGMFTSSAKKKHL